MTNLILEELIVEFERIARLRRFLWGSADQRAIAWESAAQAIAKKIAVANKSRKAEFEEA